VDTGSSNTAIPVVGCATCNSTGFDPSQSSTYNTMSCSSAECQQCTPANSTCDDCSLFFGPSYCGYNNPSACGFGVTYGGGGTAISGYYGYDTVCLGSMCTKVTLSLIDQEYPAYSLTSALSTGILGLASEFNACNPTCVPPILDSLVGAGLTSNVFGVCLNPSSGGQLDVGQIDSTRYFGSLTYAPMTFDRWYNIEILDIQVGGFSIGLPPFMYTTTNDVIGSFVDTGTSVVLMSPSSFEYFQSTFISHFSSLPGISASGFFGSVPCQRASNIDVTMYPNVTFVVQSEDTSAPLHLAVPASSYLIRSGPVYCFGIGAVPSVGVVLGDVFMENFYTVFDRVNMRVGFAPVNHANC